MEEEGAKAEEQAGDLLVDNISELDGRELSAWTGITSVEFLQVGGWSQSVSERMRPERDTRRTDGDDIDEDDDDDDALAGVAATAAASCCLLLFLRGSGVIIESYYVLL